MVAEKFSFYKCKFLNVTFRPGESWAGQRPNFENVSEHVKLQHKACYMMWCYKKSCNSMNTVRLTDVVWLVSSSLAFVLALFNYSDLPLYFSLCLEIVFLSSSGLCEPNWLIILMFHWNNCFILRQNNFLNSWETGNVFLFLNLISSVFLYILIFLVFFSIIYILF